MRQQLNHKCGEHKNNIDFCPDKVVTKKGDVYGLPIKDGGGSFMMISYCPFCGTKLNED